MPEYTLIPIHLGKINLDLGIMTYRMNYGVRKWLPIISWYVKAGKENILIDTGISSAESAYYTESPVEDLEKMREFLFRKEMDARFSSTLV